MDWKTLETAPRDLVPMTPAQTRALWAQKTAAFTRRFDAYLATVRVGDPDAHLGAVGGE